MLNKDKIRELAYVVTIDEIREIPGKDRVECAVVKGWQIMVRKDQFQVGDPAIYFEVDSKTPKTEPFEFLAQKHYKIKTQKYGLKDADGNKIGQFWSQGLLMSADDFGWTIGIDESNDKSVSFIEDTNGKRHIPGDEDTMFLTEQLGVTYADPEDNIRKSNGVDKYKKMAQRHPEIFKKKFVRWLYKRNWGKKLLFIFFGKKKDKRGWPAWVARTDEERAQNMPWILEDKTPWIATEKIDGTSTTFTMKRGKGLFGKPDFYVCSRNVCFDAPEKADHCFYETNVYTEMESKYRIRELLETLLAKHPDAEWVTIQGETYGEGIQKRDYGLKEHRFMAFNLIYSNTGRIGTLEMIKELWDIWELPCIPIVDSNFILPDTVEELLNFATGDSFVDGGMREGIVFRKPDGSQSFKAVSNEFLMKYHNG